MRDALAPRVAAIGLDSGDWQFIKSMLAEGLLPNFARIRERSAECDSDMTVRKNRQFGNRCCSQHATAIRRSLPIFKLRTSESAKSGRCQA